MMKNAVTELVKTKESEERAYWEGKKIERAAVTEGLVGKG